MHTDELLRILHEELAGCGPDIDGVLAAWLGDPAGSDEHALALQAHLRRMCAACEVIGLDGVAKVFEWIDETGRSLALQRHREPAPDEAALGAWLSWLAGWQQALSLFFECKARDDSISAIVDFISRSPVPMRLTELQQLAEVLRGEPRLPAGMVDEAAQTDSDATEDDASLQLPDDIDLGLLDVFLQDAPSALARLAAFVQTLIEGRASAADLVEAQRVAHTFKGSGNIVGIRGVGRLAHHIEDVLSFAASGSTTPPQMLRDLQQAVACLDQMVYALRGDEQAPTDARHWMQRMIEWVRVIRSGGLPSENPPASWQPPRTQTPLPADADRPATLRIDLAMVERLVRRAGQGLVQHGRVGEHLRAMEQYTRQLMASNERLLKYLRSLEIAVDRQVVSLQEKAEEPNAVLDPLEMDRYNELHALTRFAAEMAADEVDHARDACQEIEHTSAILRKHGVDLREQHRDLIGLRLVPVRNIVPRLQRTASQAAAATGKQARLVVEGDEARIDSALLDRLTEPLLHLLRNAVDHGIELPADRELLGKAAWGEVRITVQRIAGQIRMEVRDDGFGLDLGAIHARAASLGMLDDQIEPTAAELSRLILLPGFTTRNEVTETSGRGVGLDVVAERVRAMKGTLTIHTEPMMGSTFVLTVPSGEGVEHALVVEMAQMQYALPSTSVKQALASSDGSVDGRELVHGGQRVPRVWLGTWLGLPEPPDLDAAARPHVLVNAGGGQAALVVDRVIDSREVILHDVGNFLRRVPGVDGGVMRPDGRVIFTLDVEALSAGGTSPRHRGARRPLHGNVEVERKHVLVVDDAVSVRKSLEQLMRDAGFDVSVARDGQDALDVLSRKRADIILTDLEMPTLNGLELAKRVRMSSQIANTPIVMITSRNSAKHRMLASTAGVDAFLTKPHSGTHLVTEVRRLLARTLSARSAEVSLG